MRLDLRLLKQMHPLLPLIEARQLAYVGSVALQRSHHGPGCDISLTIEDRPVDLPAALEWDPVVLADAEHLDRIRVTEVGAEAVSLAFVSVARGWVERRRVQRGDFADWLLSDPNDNLVALEVSGIEGPFAQGRLVEKLRQVSKANEVVVRAACVVAFGPPAASLETL